MNDYALIFEAYQDEQFIDSDYIFMSLYCRDCGMVVNMPRGFGDEWLVRYGCDCSGSYEI